MASGPQILFLSDLALSFYLVGAIWAHEVDIFRSWQFVGQSDFPVVQRAHWKKLRYWVLAPLGVALAGAFALLWFRPAGVPLWTLRGNLACQILSLILTLAFWAKWQAKLSQDAAGPKSAYLRRILRTHWIRTLLISGAAAFLLAGAIQS